VIGDIAFDGYVIKQRERSFAPDYKTPSSYVHLWNSDDPDGWSAWHYQHGNSASSQPMIYSTPRRVSERY
jgi:hypothetical protein